MRFFHPKILSISRFSLIAFTVSITLSSCTPEKRKMLALTAGSFRDQAVDAIASVKKIYQLNDVPIDSKIYSDLIVNQLLTDPRINYGDPLAVDKIITGENQSNKQPSELDQQLDALQAEYETSVEIFNNLENIDFASARIVAKTAAPARCLTVKALLLAKQIQEKPPKLKNPQRVIIGLKLRQLRKQYNNTKIPSPLPPAEIRRQVAEQIDEWIKVNAAEKQMINESIAKLLLVASTGKKLSQLIDDYPNLSFEVIASRVTQIVGVATNFTGKDYSSIVGKISSLEHAISQDNTLKLFMADISLKNKTSQSTDSSLCQI